MSQTKVEISVTHMPEVIAILRREMARVVTQAAEGEGRAVEEFAAKVAIAFEMGLPTVELEP